MRALPAFAGCSLLLLAMAGAARADTGIAALQQKLAPATTCLNEVDLPAQELLATYPAAVAKLSHDVNARGAVLSFRLEPGKFLYECASSLDAIAKAAPPVADLDATEPEYAAALRALIPVLHEAEIYYGQEDYKDDAFARGREIDARLSPLLRRYAAASARLRSAAEGEERRLRQAELAAIAAAEGRSLQFDTVAAMVDARYAVNVVERAMQDRSLSGAVVEQAAAPLQSLLDEGTARAAEQPGEAAGFPMWGFTYDSLQGLLARLKQLRRTQEAKQRLEHADEDADAIRQEFNRLVLFYNVRGRTAATGLRKMTPPVSPVIMAAAAAPTGTALIDRPLAAPPTFAAVPAGTSPVASGPVASGPVASGPAPDAAGAAPPKAATPQQDGRRVALVIGNGGYRAVPRLANPRNDANLVAMALAQRGFTLIGGGAMLDLDKPGFDQAVRRFGAALEGADVGLFYYAGHGVQIGGQNYLVPVDANPTGERDVDFTLLNAQVVLRQLESAHTRLSLVLLDACRNNPFGGRGLRDAGGGLAEMQAPAGTLISYATQPGNVAQDGAVDSPYTTALIRAMQERGLGLFDLFNEVGLLVKDATDGAQQPWLAASPIQGRFFFTNP